MRRSRKSPVLGERLIRERHGGVGVCTPVVLLVGLFGPLNAAEVIFQLEPSLVGKDRMPVASWLHEALPRRDANPIDIAIQPLRIPTTAQNYDPLKGLFRWKSSDVDGVDLQHRVSQLTGVLWAEISPVRQTCALLDQPNDLNGADAPPDDPFFAEQWGLRQVFASAGWDIERGDSSIIIAIVDIGVDYDHGDLYRQRWVNRLEAVGRPGVDDDGNGFIDDLHGWDFFENDNDPRPPRSDNHGTHVAGIAGAATDNGYGIAGAAWDCRIMSLRTGAGGAIWYGYEGLFYAVENGARAINLSWGSDSPSLVERIAIDYALSKGALIVAAAGNLSGGSAFNHFPAGYPGVLAVAATDDRDQRASFSNSGTWVSVSAPGQSILSLLPSNGFGILSGTSMATPLVVGAAALLYSKHPDWTPQEVRLQLMRSADPIDQLNPGYNGQLGAGRLNIYRSLAASLDGFELLAIEVSDKIDGNDDGVIDPAEDIQVAFRIRNSLAATAHHVEVVPIALSGGVSFDTVRTLLGDLATGEQAGNFDTPIAGRISSNAAPGSRLRCALEVYSNDRRRQTLPFEITVRSPTASHRGGDVRLSVSDFGAIGWYDYVGESIAGEGFRVPADGPSGLFHGSLMIGGTRGRVSDNAYGDAARGRFDFASRRQGIVVDRLAGGDEVSTAYYADSRAETPLNISVKQTTYTFGSAPDDRYVIFSYEVTNSNGSDLDSLYIGLFLDWDVVESSANTLRYDRERGGGWVSYDHPVGTMFGAATLEGRPDFHVALPNRSMQNSWSDAGKLSWLIEGFKRAEGLESADWTQLIGYGPLTLASGDTFPAVFALAGGDDPTELFRHFASARYRWSIMGGARHGVRLLPETLLLSTYPEPFNNRFTAFFSSTPGGELVWRIFDPAGRRVLAGQTTVPFGNSRLQIDAGGLSSGIYHLQMISGGDIVTRRITLVR